MGAKRAQAASGLTLDAGALIALERGDGRMLALLQEALAERVTFRVPAAVLGQVWRNGARQAILVRFLRSREVEIRALDEQVARAAGELCAATGSSDVVDASVVVTALEHRDTILTSDLKDLRRISSDLQLVRV